MTSRRDVLSAICRLPIDFGKGGVSAHELIVKSGYMSHRGEVTVEMLYDRLAVDQRAVDAWQLWSENNRGWPAWYLDAVAPGKFEVGYYDKDRASRLQFDDRVRACAEYVHRELEQLANEADTVPHLWKMMKRLLRPRSK